MKFVSMLFGLFLAGTLLTGCATAPALHVIGVYAGPSPFLITDEHRSSMCAGAAQQNQTTAAPESPTVECRQKAGDKHKEKIILVNIRDDRRPIILALTAYERTLWKVCPEKGVTIKKVILGGYHSQRVCGIHAETPVETYTYDPSPCARCWQGAKYFYADDYDVSSELREITGLEPTSFQFQRQGTEFSIFPGMRTTDQ